MEKEFQKAWDAWKADDYDSAIKEWTSLAEKGHGESQNQLGMIYQRGEGVTQDAEKAAYWWTLSAEQGHKEAQYNLGMMYVRGYGVEEDPSTALYWFELASRSGDADAAFQIGNMCIAGIGIEKNPDLGVKFFLQGAESGHGMSMGTLGLMYASGYGGDETIVRAYAFLSCAVAQGLEEYVSDLGAVAKQLTPSQLEEATALISDHLPFYKGTDAYDREDYATALKEWTPLAEQGFSLAQYNLGMMYDKGRGVPQDYVRAYMWFNLSASTGDEDAIKGRDNVANKMTPSQIAEAQKLSRECVAKN